MTQPLHLSRVRLKSLRGEALASIARLLMPADPQQRPGHAHRVLWLLFQDVPDTTRDFLWRDEGEGKFMLLSQRPPTDPNGLFEVQTKEFAPELEPGDRLSFVLRANPTVAVKEARPDAEGASATSSSRGKRVDVVMRALHSVPRTEWDETTRRPVAGRALERDRIASQAAGDWLVGQAGKAGLAVEPASISVSNYVQIPLDRRSFQERRAAGKSGRPGGFSTVDMAGTSVVTDPTLFLAKLARGFGSAKAFGCGLMLIRRA